MRKNKITSIEYGFVFFSNMIFQFYIEEFRLMENGQFYNEQKRIQKYRYKIENIFQQMNPLFEKEERKTVIEKLKRIEKVVKEKKLESVSYEGPRTLEKDFKVSACSIVETYCKDLVEKIERITKKEFETKKLERIIINVSIKMYKSKKKQMLNYYEKRMLKEKAITQWLKRQKKEMKKIREHKKKITNFMFSYLKKVDLNYSNVIYLEKKNTSKILNDSYKITEKNYTEEISNFLVNIKDTKIEKVKKILNEEILQLEQRTNKFVVNDDNSEEFLLYHVNSAVLLYFQSLLFEMKKKEILDAMEISRILTIVLNYFKKLVIDDCIKKKW